MEQAPCESGKLNNTELVCGREGEDKGECECEGEGASVVAVRACVLAKGARDRSDLLHPTGNEGEPSFEP